MGSYPLSFCGKHRLAAKALLQDFPPALGKFGLTAECGIICELFSEMQI
jgi:hypothetical protein